MDLVGKNEQVLSFFSGHLTLLSGQLLKIIVYQENMSLPIELDIQLLYAQEKKNYKLKFIEVQEYSFYHQKDYIFHNISNYKFALNNGPQLGVWHNIDPDGMWVDDGKGGATTSDPNEIKMFLSDSRLANSTMLEVVEEKAKNLEKKMPVRNRH